MINPKKTLGAYVKYKYWLEAIKLLKFQVGQKKTNHYYETLSMFCYENLTEYAEKIESPVYYSQRFSSNLFYGLEGEFGYCDYALPKGKVGRRRFKYLDLATRVAFYAVGIYLVHLTQEFRANNDWRSGKIRAYFGSKLYIEGGNLVFTKANLYYKKFYDAFKNDLLKRCNEDCSNTVAFRLDAQNFYDSIDIGIFLRCLESKVKSRDKSKYDFDENCIENLKFFFLWLSNGNGGIPQHENDVVSAFLASLFSDFIDLKVENCILKQKDVKDYSILRYVDDVYIFIDFQPFCGLKVRERVAEKLLSQISDVYYFDFGIQLNSKSSQYWLSNEGAKEQLLGNIKKTSQDLPVPVDNSTTPEQKIERIFEVLEYLKGPCDSDCSFEGISEANNDTLKNIYDKVVGQMFRKAENKAKLENIINEDFDFDRVKVSSLAMTIIINKSEKSFELYRNFLLSKTDMTTSDIDMCLKFLAQDKFSSDEMLALVKESPVYSRLFKDIDSAAADFEFPGYFGLSWENISRFASNSGWIDQVRLRRYYESRMDYPRAMNHLLNEVHALCKHLDECDKPLSDYKSTHVCAFISKIVRDNDVATDILNLFDLRNGSPVSHPGTDEIPALDISKNVYLDNRRKVGAMLFKLIYSFESMNNAERSIREEKVISQVSPLDGKIEDPIGI